MPSREVIENKWQPFTRVRYITWPDCLPFRVEFMADDGQRDVVTIVSFNDLDRLEDHSHIVSIRIFDAVDEKTQLVRNLIADYIPTNHTPKYQPSRIREGSLDRHHTTAVVRGIVESYGLMGMKPEKVDVNLPAQAAKLVPTKYHQMVANWLADVNNDDYVLHNDFVEHKLNNSLLAVRNYGSCGRRVILPMGHSLGYTQAQKVYWRIMSAGTLTEYGRDMTITVGELRGKHRQMIDHRATFHSGRGMITIGCQRIPFSALSELAEREGWPKKDPSGYA